MKARGVSVNIYVGNKHPYLNLIALVTLLLFPRFLVVKEAKLIKGSIPGYRAYRAPSNMTKSLDYGSTIFLVRRGTKVLSEEWFQVPNGEWQFEDNKREARVYGRLTLKIRKHIFDVFGLHRCPLGPNPPRPVNRKAWIAEHNFLVEKNRSRSPRPTLWVADWNTRETTDPDDDYSLKSLAEMLGAKMSVLGIDGFLTRGVKVRKVWKLDKKFGSDHHYPVAMDFEL